MPLVRVEVAALMLACVTGCAVNLDSVAVAWPESLELAFVVERDDNGRISDVRGRYPDPDGPTSFYSLNDPWIFGWDFEALRRTAPLLDETRMHEAELRLEPEACEERGRAIDSTAESWPLPADTQLYELSLGDGSLTPIDQPNLEGLSLQLPIDYGACAGGQRAELRPFVGDGTLASHSEGTVPTQTFSDVARIDDDRVAAVSALILSLVDRRRPYRDEPGHRIRLAELGVPGGFRDIAVMPIAEGHRVFTVIRDLDNEQHWPMHVDVTDAGLGTPVLGPRIEGLPHGIGADDRAAYVVTTEEVWTGTTADDLTVALSLPGRYMREIAVGGGSAPHVIVGLVGLILEGDLLEGTMEESTLSRALGAQATYDLYEVAFSGDELWLGSDNEGLFYRNAEGRWGAAAVEFRHESECLAPPDECGRRNPKRSVKHVGDGSNVFLTMSGDCDLAMFVRWSDDCVLPVDISDAINQDEPLDLNRADGADGRVTISGTRAMLLEIVR